jgi:membrane fusion protein, multidrug efflux system
VKNPHKQNWLAATLLLLAAMILVVGCGQSNDAQAAAGPPPAPVVAGKVEQHDIPVQLTSIGNVESFQTVQIRSQVNGQIVGVHFKEGQDISKGQLLFTLDKRPFQAALDQAVGNLKRDQAQAANAEVQAKRYAELQQQGVVAREQADQVIAQAKSNASVVAADEAAVEAARVQLQYTEIRSPIDGRAGALQINLGNLVKANDTPFLVQLNQITPIYVTFTVPEASLSQVRKYISNDVKVIARSKGQSTADGAEGNLTFIDNGVDPTTGTVKLKGTFTNKDRRLWPGEFVDVSLNLAMQKNAIIVPTKAVQTGQQGDYVYVIKQDNTAEARPVTVAGTYQNVTLIAKGVNAGETVVVDGQMRVVPNGKVAVQSTVPTSVTSNAEVPPPAGSGL